MGAAVMVTRQDLNAAELRAASAKCTDGARVRRMMAVAMVLEGRSRSEATSLHGMVRQTLSDWAHRYSDRGEKLTDLLVRARAPQWASGASRTSGHLRHPTRAAEWSRSWIGAQKTSASLIHRLGIHGQLGLAWP
jgi:transposase